MKTEMGQGRGRSQGVFVSPIEGRGETRCVVLRKKKQVCYIRTGQDASSFLAMAEMCGSLVLLVLFLQFSGGCVDRQVVFGVVSDRTLRAHTHPVNPLMTFVNDRVQMQASIVSLCKVVRDVSRKDGSASWQTAQRGEVLSSGGRIRTGEQSVAVMKFRDRSFVIVHERSELAVIGMTEGSWLSKTIILEDGMVGFDINKQRHDEECRFTSPVSVASIRGTMGRFVSHGLSDTLTVIEGAVLLTNAISHENVEVRAGYTGISNRDGTISARLATPDELISAGNAARADEETMQVASSEIVTCFW